VFIKAKGDGGGGDNWTTGAISLAKFQSNRQHQQTNIHFFTGRMPFLSPNQAVCSRNALYKSTFYLLTYNQQCQSTEGKFESKYYCV